MEHHCFLLCEYYLKKWDILQKSGTIKLQMKSHQTGMELSKLFLGTLKGLQPGSACMGDRSCHGKMNKGKSSYSLVARPSLNLRRRREEEYLSVSLSLGTVDILSNMDLQETKHGHLTKPHLRYPQMIPMANPLLT